MRIEKGLWILIGCLGCVQTPEADNEVLAHLQGDAGAGLGDAGPVKPPLGHLPSGPACGSPERGPGGSNARPDDAISGGDDAGQVDPDGSGWADPGPRFAAPTRAGDLIITELMIDPSSVSDAVGEWFELYNPGAAPLHLGGCFIDDGGSEARVIGDGAVIGADDYFIVARSEAGGSTPDYVTSFSFTNSADRLAILCGGVEIDRVAYDKAAGWPLLVGASLVLDVRVRDPQDNDLASNWCAAKDSYGPELGSPGAENPACVDGVIETP